MGNCANKPLTSEEGGAPAPEEKPAEVTAVEREITVEAAATTEVENKVIGDVADHDPTTPRSLAQMLEEEGKKPEAEAAVKAVEEKIVEPVKEVVEATKPASEPAKAEASEPKKEEAKPAEAPAKPEEKKPETK